MTNRYDALISELEAEQQALSDKIVMLKKWRDGKTPKVRSSVSHHLINDDTMVFERSIPYPNVEKKRHARGSVKIGLLQALEAGNKSSADIQAFLADSGIEKTIAAIGTSMFAFKKDGLIKTPSAGVYVLAAAGKKYLKESQEKA